MVDIVFVLKRLEYRHEMITVYVNFVYIAHFKKAKVLSSKNKYREINEIIVLLGKKEEVCVHHPPPPPQSHQLRWIVIGLLTLVFLYSCVITSFYIRQKVTI